MNKWKVAAYLRLSIDDGEKTESNSITNQKEMISSFAKKDKELVIKDYYIDDGYSGTDFERPNFQRMMMDITKGKIDTIIVKDLSRFGRNYIETGRYIEEFFPTNNIRFIAINDNIDSYKDPKSIDNVIVPFKNLINDEYARDISNKIRSVLDTKKENGEFIGSFAPFGYKKDERNKNHLLLDDYSSKIVKKIFNMILKGKSRSEVIKELNELKIPTPSAYKMQTNQLKEKSKKSMATWDRKKIDFILKNQTYTGDLIQSKTKVISHRVHKIKYNTKDDWIIIHNHHAAIITKEEFKQVHDILYNRDTKIKQNNKLDIFSGHLKCADCGNNLSSVKAKNHTYYYCTSYLRHKECSKHSIDKDDIEKVVLDLINKQIDLNVEIEEKIKIISEKIKVDYDKEILKNRLKTLEDDINKYNLFKRSVIADYESGFISREEYEEYNMEYSKKMTELVVVKNKTILEMEKNNIKTDNTSNLIKKYNKHINVLNKTIIDEMIEYIYIYNDNKIKIVFKYEDEFNLAIDFIKKHKCDIIGKELNEIELKEVI